MYVDVSCCNVVIAHTSHITIYIMDEFCECCDVMRCYMAHIHVGRDRQEEKERDEGVSVTVILPILWVTSNALNCFEKCVRTH